MAMAVGPASGTQDVMVEINTTPLIDVMLVLLIMLIITIPIQTHAVKLEMPNPNAPPPTFEPEVININVEFDGTVDWNDQVVARPDDPASYDVLETYLKDVGKQPVETQSEIHLSADRVVKYDHVARVLAMAQRNRVIKIGLVGNEAFLGQ